MELRGQHWMSAESGVLCYVRVQPGECYHLYTAFQEARFADYQLPEMLRTRLEELCLQIKVNGSSEHLTHLWLVSHLTLLSIILLISLR